MPEQLDARIGEVLDRLETIEARLLRLETGLARGFALLDARLTATEARLEAVEMRLSDGTAEAEPVTSLDRL